MTPIPKHTVSTSLAVVVLSIGAAIACLWFTTPATRSLVPAVFTVVVVVVALRFGAAAGILGSLVGAAIFARWLYAPFNSLSIHDAAARQHLGWMLLAGISLSYLLAAPGASEKREPKE